MSKATEVLGNDLMLFADGKTIALATSHTFKASTEITDTSNKDTGRWGAGIPGKKSWEMTSENTYGVEVGTTQQSYDKLFEMWTNDTKVKVNFGIPSNADAAGEMPDGGWTLPEGSYEGEAYITNIDLNAPDGQEASFSITLRGVGAIKKVESKA